VPNANSTVAVTPRKRTGVSGGKGEPETLYIHTDDDWRLALHHWPQAPVTRRHPVLMVHGFGANRLTFDFDKRYSLARALRRQGFAVYILELRGAGFSQAPGGRDRTRFQWGFHEYSTYDVPAAIAAVLERSGVDALHGVGHSMGGMLMYAQGVRRTGVLRSIISVGSPLISDLNLGIREKRLLQLATSIAPSSVQRRVPLRRLVGAAGIFIPLTSRLADGLFLNSDNTEAEVLARYIKDGITDVPLQLVMEMTRHMAHGKRAKGDTSPYAYEERLAEIDVPVLAFGGAADRVAPAASVRAAVARLAPPYLAYRELAERFGDVADYGHMDLILGRRAPEEVFPLILDFLREMD